MIPSHWSGQDGLDYAVVITAESPYNVKESYFTSTPLWISWGFRCLSSSILRTQEISQAATILSIAGHHSGRKRELWKAWPKTIQWKPRWTQSTYAQIFLARSGDTSLPITPQGSNTLWFYTVAGIGGAGNTQWVAWMTTTVAILCWELKTGNV